ncbi:MAG: 16S rRNA (adenine(1518)-N(6)/adenine(1519)-N(6))-dimethyltransferase RsmA [Clostridia bacterium]|nr:16S rRNA (adenine(1518)-N(6)/adenine(1519)-N(6))-dimethyltransferase RsmA [Clostridia bacterium]
MDNLTDIGAIKALLARHGFHFSKSLGQNFLINPSVCPRMAEACGATPDTGVLEIGPGIGTLTQALCQKAGKVVSIELDERLPAVLAETMADFDNFMLIQGDAMTIDLAALLTEQFGDRPVAVCANLPYYITSPLIMRLLESRLPVTNLTVMVQKEAAERLCAAPGTRACGAVTLTVQYYAEAETLFQVSRGSFLPAPNVDSTVIRLTCRTEPPCHPLDERFMFTLIRAAFGQRRKTIANSLMTAGLTKDRIKAACDVCDISPLARAEELTLTEFSALADAFTTGGAL